jgi:hypothetical protein
MRFGATFFQWPIPALTGQSDEGIVMSLTPGKQSASREVGIVTESPTTGATTQAVAPAAAAAQPL